MGKSSKRKRERKLQADLPKKRSEIMSENFNKYKIWPLIYYGAILYLESVVGTVLTEHVSASMGFWFWVVSFLALASYLAIKAFRRVFPNNNVTKKTRLLIILTVAVAILGTTQFYIGWLINPSGQIELPSGAPRNQIVTIHWGEGRTTTERTIEQLSQEPSSFLSYYETYGGDEFQVISIGEKDKKITLFASLFAGQNKPPVIIDSNSKIDLLPDGWHTNDTYNAKEIYNENGVPVLSILYKDKYNLFVGGIFQSPKGIYVMDNSPRGIFSLYGDISGIGEYRVYKTEIRSVFDYFFKERAYKFDE